MSRTKFTPNEQDLKSIKSFLKSVSWGSECTLCTRLDGSAAYLLAPSLYILCSCPWEAYDNFKVTAKERADIHGVKPGIIITNEADKQNCERIWWDATQNSIVVYWFAVKNSLQSNHLMMSALEGIDWQKSLVAVMEDGVDAKPVFEWEKGE